MLHENGAWLDCAHIFALDSSTIGVAGHEMPEWAQNACFKETAPIQKNRETVVFEIPERFSRFYNLASKHITVTVNGNVILITITGNLIKQKRYPA
ncbi:MAG: hypothetical protein NWE93_13985 [Candidatus Bathyarchaeota archaeon]|nr:hypothetical protein [Candidatus Bathyarchaeota archaeon]